MFCYQGLARCLLFLIGRPQALFGGQSHEEKYLLSCPEQIMTFLTVLLCIGGICCSVTLLS